MVCRLAAVQNQNEKEPIVTLLHLLNFSCFCCGYLYVVIVLLLLSLSRPHWQNGEKGCSVEEIEAVKAF
jgi:hypothetical protein